MNESDKEPEYYEETCDMWCSRDRNRCCPDDETCCRSTDRVAKPIEAGSE